MLNETQRATLRAAIKVAVDGIIEQGLLEWLERCIAPNNLTIQDVMASFEASYLEQINQAINIPVEIRQTWSRFAEYVQRRDHSLPGDLLETLHRCPNYDPFRLATIQKFTAQIAGVPEPGCGFLIRLRETYLEMTPVQNYSYGANYREFQFRIGNVPFNLDQYGPFPTPGEIQADIAAYVEERIELQEEHQRELTEERRLHNEQQRQLTEERQELEQALADSQQLESDLQYAVSIKEQELKAYQAKHDNRARETRQQVDDLTTKLRTTQDDLREQQEKSKAFQESIQALQQQEHNQVLAQRYQDKEIAGFQRRSDFKQEQLDHIRQTLSHTNLSQSRNEQLEQENKSLREMLAQMQSQMTLQTQMMQQMQQQQTALQNLLQTTTTTSTQSAPSPVQSETNNRHRIFTPQPERTNSLRHTQPATGPSREQHSQISPIQSADPRVKQLLNHVARGEQDEAETMLKETPALGCVTENVTDLSKRCFKGITALQYAVWARDWHMWTMIMKYLPKAAAREQCLVFQNGSAPWMQQHGKQFDLNPLIESLQTYVNKSKEWKYNQSENYWCKTIGGLQRRLPVHVINEYCRPDRSFYPTPNFREATLPRRGAVYDGEEHGIDWWFNSVHIGGMLGARWGCGSAGTAWSRGIKWCVTSTLPWLPATNDVNSLQVLSTTRDQQVAELLASLDLTTNVRSVPSPI